MHEKIFTICCFILFINSKVFAGNKDREFVVENAKNEFEFVYNKKENRVEVKEIQYIKYKCVRNAVLQVGETYSDNISIDDVTIRSNGSKAKWITPKYEYMSSNEIFFSDQRVCFFNVDMKKDDDLEVTFEKTYFDPKYFCQVYFDDGYDIESKEIKITVPKWMKLDIKEYNFSGYTITKNIQPTKKDDADVYTFTGTGMQHIKKMSHSPGASYYLPHILVLLKSANPKDDISFNYFNTTADQYAWYKTLVKNIDNDKSILKNKAQEITSGLTSDMDKIKAIFYWVQNNIRYLAFEDGIAGFRPDKAHEVLRKKYGDCKGMAHLTKELLVALGFDARLCWIGTNHIAYNYSTPALCVDNHMICALVYQGKTYYLDATEKYIGFNEYAERIQGRQVLYEDGDKYVLANVPATTYLQNKDYEKRLLTIDGTSIKGTVQHDWYGEEKEFLLSNINNTKKENLKEAFERFLKGGNNDVTLTDVTTSDLTNFDKNISVKYTINQKNALSSFGKEYYLELDNSKDFGEFDIDTSRKLDYWQTFKYNVVHEYEVTLPANSKITTLPAALKISNADYDIDLSYTQQQNKLLYKKTILIKNTVIRNSDIAKWNADMKKLKDFYSEQVIITTN